MAEGVIAGGRALADALTNRQQALLLENRTATATGPAIDTSKIRKGSVVVRGITVATVQIEGSNDGTNFEKIGADITADATVEINTYAKNIRAVISAYTTGTIFVDYAGIA